MSVSPAYKKGITGLGIGLISGLMFAFLLGESDLARYLVGKLTVTTFAVLWILLAAYVTVRYGRLVGITYLVSGLIGAAIMMSFSTIFPAGGFFLVTAVSGIIIAESQRILNVSPAYGNILKGMAVGLLSGVIFAFFLGEFDPARYLIEQLTVIPFEALWMAAAAYVTVRYGAASGLAYLVCGSIGAVLPFPPVSVTGAVFLKTAAAGVIIGESHRFGKGYAPRIAAVSLPGVVFAGIVGFPYLYGGVSDAVLAKVKQDALDTYLLFMSPDDARNAADNAMSMLGGVFGVGVAVLVLGAVATVWLAFLIFRWMNRNREAIREPGPSIGGFSLPFWVIWVFLASFGLVLSELEFFYPAALNIFIIIAGLYGVQGMAVIAHFMRTGGFGRMSRVLFWLVFFITLAFSAIIVVFIGIIDNWFHLRSVPSAPGAGGGDEGTDNEGDSQR